MKFYLKSQTHQINSLYDENKDGEKKKKNNK